MFISKIIDKRIAAYQHRLIETHFNEVENMYKQMRGWAHDYRNHLQIMKSFAQEGDIKSVLNYLDELGEDLQETGPGHIRTGNKMCDTILNSKIAFAEANSIKLIAEANIAIELSTGQIDLCIIIGNLMDNAIEACLDLPEKDRLIRIYMEMKGTQLYMSFTNTSAGKKRKKIAKRFATTKGEGHGFGLARVDNIIERHSGYISRNSEEGAYSTEIMLPQ